jgi:hypothetical protein
MSGRWHARIHGNVRGSRGILALMFGTGDQEQSAMTGGAMTGADADAASQIEQAHPGYRVWVSDENWWYATRVGPQARGPSLTVSGRNARELAAELAADAARPAVPPGPVPHWPGA